MVELQRERGGKGSLIGTTDGGVDQQYRTMFCALKCGRSSYTPVISMDGGLLVNASPRVLGKEDRALAVGGGRVRATKSSSSNTWGKGLEKVEELQIERDDWDSLLGTTHRIDQHYRTTFCALKHARSNSEPAMFMGSRFTVDACFGST